MWETARLSSNGSWFSGATLNIAKNCQYHYPIVRVHTFSGFAVTFCKFSLSPLDQFLNYYQKKTIKRRNHVTNVEIFRKDYLDIRIILLTTVNKYLERSG